MAAALSQIRGGAFVQWNCNGVQNSRTELAGYLSKKGIIVACLQESKLSCANPYTNFPSFFSLRRDRPDGRIGGGLLTLLHQDITFTTLNTNRLFPGVSTIEHQSITFTVDDAKQIIINLYILPTSSCTIGYRPTLQHLLTSNDEDTLIVGDFNAHYREWISQTGSDHAITRGITINSLFNECSLTFLNENIQTRVSYDGTSYSNELTRANIPPPHPRITGLSLEARDNSKFRSPANHHQNGRLVPRPPQTQITHTKTTVWLDRTTSRRRRS